MEEHFVYAILLPICLIGGYMLLHELSREGWFSEFKEEPINLAIITIVAIAMIYVSVYIIYKAIKIGAWVVMVKDFIFGIVILFFCLFLIDFGLLFFRKQKKSDPS